jgi:hypothetical protein
MSKENVNTDKKCCLCGKNIEGEYGNNASPYGDSNNSTCCDDCNAYIVIPTRIQQTLGEHFNFNNQ